VSIHLKANLKAFNTFSVAHTAAELFVVESDADIPVLLERISSQAMPTVLLGGGSNVLFTGDYAGRVVVNRLRGFSVVEESNDTVLLRIAAGENWHAVVQKCLKLGYFGLENLSLIPGSVGAAPVQNIGAYGVELSSVLDSVSAVHLQTGEKRDFTRAECQLSYRNSLFKQAGSADWMITDVNLCLDKQPRFTLTYKGLEALQDKADAGALTAAEVSQAVVALRQSKLPDPGVVANAGSFFKNPVVSVERAEELLSRFPTCPSFFHGKERKLSAAWLLEQSQWKAHRRGDAGVYQNHALVLVNHGKATGQEIWSLAGDMRTSVEDRFGIRLEPEIKVL
jgi:UDP-N-acetylmuramate dehydrogenase